MRLHRLPKTSQIAELSFAAPPACFLASGRNLLRLIRILNAEQQFETESDLVEDNRVRLANHSKIYVYLWRTCAMRKSVTHAFDKPNVDQTKSDLVGDIHALLMPDPSTILARARTVMAQSKLACPTRRNRSPATQHGRQCLRESLSPRLCTTVRSTTNRSAIPAFGPCSAT